MTLQENTHYLALSKLTPEIVLDKHYSEIALATIDIKRQLYNLIAINSLFSCIKNNRNDEASYHKLKGLLRETPIKTPFECFLYACDCAKEDILNNEDSFRGAVCLYIDNRSLLGNNEQSLTWYQALIDRDVSFSRQRSATTKAKIKKIAQQAGLRVIDEGDDNIKLIIGGKYAAIRLIHLRASGGSQNNHIKKLLHFLELPATEEQPFACVFADGLYSNTIISKPKIAAILTDNSSAFWFNTAGFEAFIRDGAS